MYLGGGGVGSGGPFGGRGGGRYRAGRGCHRVTGDQDGGNRPGGGYQGYHAGEGVTLSSRSRASPGPRLPRPALRCSTCGAPEPSPTRGVLLCAERGLLARPMLGGSSMPPGTDYFGKRPPHRLTCPGGRPMAVFHSMPLSLRLPLQGVPTGAACSLQLGTVATNQDHGCGRDIANAVLSMLMVSTSTRHSASSSSLTDYMCRRSFVGGPVVQCTQNNSLAMTAWGNIQWRLVMPSLLVLAAVARPGVHVYSVQNVPLGTAVCLTKFMPGKDAVSCRLPVRGTMWSPECLHIGNLMSPSHPT